MFAKLLKYEMRSIAKIWWIIPSIVLTASVGFGFVLLFLMNSSVNEELPLNFVLSMLLMQFVYVGYIFILSAAVIGSTIMVHLRYYKTMFTDEGYLTFTLPVSRKQLYGAKTMSAVIWTFLTGTVCILGVTTVLLIGFAPTVATFWRSISVVIRDMIAHLGLNNFGGVLLISLWAFEGIVCLAASTYLTVQWAQFCLTFGGTMVRKFKLLLSIGMYLGVDYLWSGLAYVVMFPLSYATIFSISLSILANPLVLKPMIGIVLLLIICMVLSFGMILHFINVRMLEKKLNLA